MAHWNGTSVLSSQFSVLALDQARCAERPAQTFSPTFGKLEVVEAFHLPRKACAVTVPPDFLHPGHAIGINIFQPHHFFQAKTAVSPAYATRLYAAVGRLTDTEARDHVIHHNGASLNVPRQALAAFFVPGPH